MKAVYSCVFARDPNIEGVYEVASAGVETLGVIAYNMRRTWDIPLEAEFLQFRVYPEPTEESTPMSKLLGTVFVSDFKEGALKRIKQGSRHVELLWW